MKKQNVKNKLAFNKATVNELNDGQMVNVNGGSSIPCGILFSITLTLAGGAGSSSNPDPIFGGGFE